MLRIYWTGVSLARVVVRRGAGGGFTYIYTYIYIASVSSVRARAKTTSILDTRSSSCERERRGGQGGSDGSSRGRKWRGKGIACEDVAEEKLPALTLETAACEPLNFSEGLMPRP